MIILTTDTFPEKEYEVIGLVQGNTIQSKNAIKDMGQGFKNIVGGELKSYTKMMSEARTLATSRMIENATNLGADAIIAARYSSASVMQGAAEIMAYGTAIKFK